jgi:hypothetical protein
MCNCNKCSERGERGKRGKRGVTGPTGSPGLNGNTGATGPVGLNGDTGASGLNGATGPQGVKGDTGSQGPVGSQGIQGPVGPTGSGGIFNSAVWYSTILLGSQPSAFAMPINFGLLANRSYFFNMVIVGASVETPPNSQATAFQYQLRFGIRTDDTMSELSAGACVPVIDKWRCYGNSSLTDVAVTNFGNSQIMNVIITTQVPGDTPDYNIHTILEWTSVSSYGLFP